VNERDILFNIQSYLSLPFNYSLCDCYDFTDRQKAKLQEHVNTLKQSLETLNSDANLEVKCKLMEEVKGEVRRQLQFVSGIQAILNSNCCTKRNKLTGS
jgi:queuine/archaeosine tRNA-ribosyltransferase